MYANIQIPLCNSVAHMSVTASFRFYSTEK